MLPQILRYAETKICTLEIPDEVCLGILVAGCPLRCTECHTSDFQDKNDLTYLPELKTSLMGKILRQERYVSCVLFMGGEWNLVKLVELCKWIRLQTNLKIALYTGRDLRWMEDNCSELIKYLDYLKVGPYIAEKGDLRCKSTNQVLYKLVHCVKYFNITDKLWGKQ